MKVPLSWLRDYVDITLTPRELAHRLTMAGLTVASIEETGAGWEGVVVAEIKRIEPIPGKDRVRLAIVDAGQGERMVVCGAPNIAPGQRVPLATVGTSLRGMTVERRHFGGTIYSEGMLCSARELAISDDHGGILQLAPDAPLGAPLRELLGEAVLELEVGANRGDCLSFIGVAREVAGLSGAMLRLPEPEIEEAPPPAHEEVDLAIADPALCARYTARILRGVRVGPSPEWMQRRLLAAGMRPVNNIVDVTNYVMLEWGQPLHAFDFAALRGPAIEVRRGRPGESMTTLDGVTRELTPDMLMIADAERSVAIAGVMGGLETEVTEGTTSVLIESANFDQISIRRTSRVLGLHSEASSRFEKGIDPERTVPAVDRAAQLMVRLAGGEVLAGVADCFPGPTPERVIHLTAADAARLLGVRYTAAQVAAALRRLEFECDMTGDDIAVKPPTFRRDVHEKADLVEEVARIYGYEAIPTTMPAGPLPEKQVNPSLELEDRLRGLLAGAGLAESIGYPLVSADLHARLVAPEHQAPAPLQPIKVANPMTPQQEYLRLTLAGTLLQTLSYNVRFNPGALAFFELGRSYWPRECTADSAQWTVDETAREARQLETRNSKLDTRLPAERRLLAGAICGEWQEQRWCEAPRQADFFDLKGVLELLADALDVDLTYTPLRHPTFQSGQAALLSIAEAQPLAANEAASYLLRLPYESAGQSGRVVGLAGRVHPLVAARFDLEEPLYLFEIDLEALMPCLGDVARYQHLSRFPALRQDLALVVDEAVPAGALTRLIAEEGGAAVSQVRLFDVYRGAPVPKGRKSLAFSIAYQASDHTLTDEEVRPIREAILARARRDLKAQLR